MLTDSPAFSGFSVTDLAAAAAFYHDVLGLDVTDGPMGLQLNVSGGRPVYVYEKADHVPATFTILNFPVDDIGQAVSGLAGKGVSLEHYDNLTDVTGVARGLSANRGPDIAWFKDPAGNILSVLQEK